MEQVGYWHQAHSFVRGNWRNEKESNCMILAKCCHDMDIFVWLSGKRCKTVSSFGSLGHFKPENAPKGAAGRCTECPVGDTCPYNAVKLYLESDSAWFRNAATQKIGPTDEEVEAALRNTQYGKCVFHCNNNVVDHQVVNLEFEDQTTVTFSMCAFNKGGRDIRIMGTKGELWGKHGEPNLHFYDFETKETREISTENVAVDHSIVGGHGGGDAGIVNAFYDLLTGVENFSLCDISEAVDNHMIAFAAEEARLTGRVIDMEEFKKEKRQTK